MIRNIISRKVIIDENEYKSHSRQLIEITSELPLPPSGREDLKFEVTAFNYLLNNKQKLGIDNVYKLKASCADGLLRLDRGDMVLLEIKYVLGWAKCCQARMQFERFINEGLHNKFKIDKPQNAVIVFRHFGGDWNKPRKDRECGWVYFYEDEQVLNKSLIKTDILQLVDLELISYFGVVTDLPRSQADKSRFFHKIAQNKAF